MAQKKPNFILLMIVAGISLLLFAAGLYRVRIDTDIVSSLPVADRVIADAIHIFNHHPIKDRIAIDVRIQPADKHLLVKIGTQVEERLVKSGLFDRVGLDDMQSLMPALIEDLTNRMPFLFSEADLEKKIAPLIAPARVKAELSELTQSLYHLQSVGQANLISKDPLGFRNLLLEALAGLAPSSTGKIFKGKLISADEHHLLVIATPKGSGTDTGTARKLVDLIQSTSLDLNTAYASHGTGIVLTPVGAFRAALDNETIVKKDVNKAILLATLGIALMLLLAFPRPLMGLLALVPAVCGTAVAFFIYTLICDTISIMVLGFGGAVISITVDHGIAYLLFIDRPSQTSGKDASKEVWSIGLIAALTTMGAFGVLGVSGFPVFEQLGLFTALGIGCSFLFVHLVFPWVFPVMPPAKKQRKRPLRHVADRMAGFGPWGAAAAAALAGVLVFFAKPGFNVDLGAMNSISRSTQNAEQLITDVWGNMFDRVYLMVEAPAATDLLEKEDRLFAQLEAASEQGMMSTPFSMSRFFPQGERRQENFNAWKRFWTKDRITALNRQMASEGKNLGFTEAAFSPFFKLLESPPIQAQPVSIPENLFGLMGISKTGSDGKWRQVVAVKPMEGYDGELFFSDFSEQARIFDPGLFSERMGRLLFDTFLKMLAIIAASITILLLFFFADLALTVISLLPIGFALVCTLGTLGLMGKSLDIPALMLAIVILGMGVDYALFMVRSYQRYQDPDHRMFSLVRMAVLMASVSTLIGFSVLIFAQHNLLKSIGFTCFMGIFYSLAGAFLILPPLLKRKFAKPGIKDGHSKDPTWRYRNMEAYPRMFARFKLKLDPMFAELDALLPKNKAVRQIMDIGCGYGVPGCWLLERYENARLSGIEPLADRVRVAGMALGESGVVIQGKAPDLPVCEGNADLVFMLDMNHFLDDAAFAMTLEKVCRKLSPDGFLFLRSVIPSTGFSFWNCVEDMKMRLGKVVPHHRQVEEVADIIARSGFDIIDSRPSGKRNELHWFIAGPEQ